MISLWPIVISIIQQALTDLYGGQEVSLQQLSATFRRGDLIEKLDRIEMSKNKA
jgi:hypothetical protein